MAAVITVNNLPHSLLYSRESCTTYCQNINRKENREKKYLKLLRLFLSAVTSGQVQGDIKTIKKNLWAVVQLMPEEIKKREQIQLISASLAKEIQAVQKAQIAKSLQDILGKLSAATDSQQLDKTYQKMIKIGRELPQEWEVEFDSAIEACRQAYKTRQPCSSGQLAISEPKVAKKIYRVLSIDGGGIRAIIPATLLVAIEKLTCTPISKLFDFMGGTSTGGMLTLGLAKPHVDGSGRPQYRAEELLQIYTEETSLIYQENTGYQRLPQVLSTLDKLARVFQQPRYLDPAPFFMKKFSNAPLASALTDILITTNDYQEVTRKIVQVGVHSVMARFAMGSSILDSPTPTYISHNNFYKSIHYFSKYGLNILKYKLKKQTNPLSLCTINTVSNESFTMNFALQASSAIPTLFPSTTYSDKVFIDGGVLQNNPAIPCIFDAVKRGYDTNDLLLVSLGTGVVSAQPISHDFASSIVSNGSHLTQPDFETPEAIKILLRPSAYHRFQYPFPTQAPNLDDVKPETLALLQEAGCACVESNIDELRDLCKQLMPDCI